MELNHLTKVLSSLPYNFKILQFNGTLSSYQAEIRSRLLNETKEPSTYSKLCDQWIRRFSAATKTEWITRETWPNAERFEYRKQFVCHHNKFNKSPSTDYKSMPKSRDKNCNAKIDIKIKKDTVDTRKKDSHMKDGLNTIIKISFEHSHLINVAQAFSYLRVDIETEQLFKKYFDEGLTASGAKTYHEVFLLSNQDESGEDVGSILANAKINPTGRQISHLYDQWRKENYGDRSSLSVVELLRKKEDQFLKCGVQILVEENPFTVVIVTPTMRRIHEQPFSSEIIFVDSSGSCDQTNTCVTFMFCASKIGALPLVTILHASQTTDCYYAAFSRAISVIGTQGFGGGGYPDVIMTDDSDPERKALSKAFPLSTLLLCSFHVCQALWRWLWDGNHGIVKTDRRILMNLFRGVLFETDKTNCEELFNILTCHETSKKYPQFLNHAMKFWQRRSEWAYSFRQTIPTRGHNTNNFVEASIRVFKEIVLQRCKSFNACALVDFIGNVFESYHKRKLLTFANCRVSKPELLYKRLVEKAKNLKVSQLNEYEFQVNSSKDETLVYLVDIEFETCDCPAGNGGSFCKHLCAVNIFLDGILLNSPALTSDDRILFAKLALGDSANLSFYKDMMETESFTEENNQLLELTSDEILASSSSQPPFSIELESQNHPSTLISVEVIEPSSFFMHVTTLRNHFERICTIAESNYTPTLEKCLSKMNSQLNKVNSVTELQNHFFGSLRQFTGRRICVQPTSLSRRKLRRGLKCGSRVIQAGRPSNVEIGKIIKRKRRRVLGRNIQLNLPNAKPHGSNH